MDGRADILLTTSYTRYPSVAAAAGANPSTRSFGFASVGAPPSTGLARGLFMASQTTSAKRGVVPAPAVKPHVPLSKFPNATVAKAGKNRTEVIFRPERSKEVFPTMTRHAPPPPASPSPSSRADDTGSSPPQLLPGCFPLGQSLHTKEAIFHPPYIRCFHLPSSSSPSALALLLCGAVLCCAVRARWSRSELEFTCSCLDRSMAMAPYEQVVDDLAKGQEFATQLQGLLRDSPKAGLIMDQILHTFSRAIHAAKAAAAASASASSGSEVTDGATSGGKRKSAAGGGPRKACRTRTHDSSVVTKKMKSLEDGQTWRKYGQKEIQNSKHSKAYFRCTHKYDQQCPARRQAQRCDEDPDTFAPAAAHVLPTTSTTTTNTNLVDQDAAARGSGLRLPGLKLEGGDLEEVLSSRTPGSSALHGAATWPDQGDVTSTLQYGLGQGDLFLDGYTYLEDFMPLPYGLDH
ncbi:WRKY transcription factor 32 [Hordeum vulgare]|nr:WRKY transcription factor 32 [Hordeum vulgare]